MINYNLIAAIKALRCPGMAKELEAQLHSPQSFNNLSFEERLEMLVNAEKSSRYSNTTKTLLKKSNLKNPDASIEDILYFEDRHLKKEEISEFATCKYIGNKNNIVLQGPTGVGKTYIACALGNMACRKHFRVLYRRMPDLLRELRLMHNKPDEYYNKYMKLYLKNDLIIIDEWLLRSLNHDMSYMMLELVEKFQDFGSFIFCSQFSTDEWYYRIDQKNDAQDGSVVAEAILDRLINKSYIVTIHGKSSMRSRKIDK